ncbi:MAG: hypothetical protein ACMUIM_07835, partial [bacterium]
HSSSASLRLTKFCWSIRPLKKIPLSTEMTFYEYLIKSNPSALGHSKKGHATAEMTFYESIKFNILFHIDWRLDKIAAIF